LSPTNIFAPASTSAHSIFQLSLFVIAVAAVIFAVVAGLLVYAVLKFRRRRQDDGREPAQIYGSTRIELAWTVIPVLIVLVLFLASARVIFSVQDASHPQGALEVTVIGHQYWWEYRYPGQNVVTANELHLPVGERTLLKLLSADTDHSFWVPRLAGKTDLIPNHPNETWIEPSETGLYLGQCAQYCGTQHGKMLLRVYVQTRADFDAWIREQAAPVRAQAAPARADGVSEGRKIFEQSACINCHAVAGTPANGRFGPDLTHLMSRETIGSGIARNTPENLRRWIRRPDDFKRGSLMPAMGLSDSELDAITTYLTSLR
jgi:cytochrome c oxidase subunit 2